MRNDFKQPDALLLCERPVISAVILFALLSASGLGGENPDSLRWRRPTQSYEFDTGILFGCIDPYSWYHGVAGLMHRDFPLDVVRPRKAFLNAEYYLRPGSGKLMLPREISSARKTTHELANGTIWIRFPPEESYGVALDIAYRPHADFIDMHVHLTPSKDVAAFELFFASYVGEQFHETWVPLEDEDGDLAWKRLENRRNLNEVFAIVRDANQHSRLDDGRWGGRMTEDTNVVIQRQHFSRPILVARDPQTGFALVFLCDATATTLLAGQYHVWDTAHDWCFGFDLVQGKPVQASARLIFRRFHDPEQMAETLHREWSAFDSRNGTGPQIEGPPGKQPNRATEIRTGDESRQGFETPGTPEDEKEFKARTLQALDDLMGRAPFGSDPPLSPRVLSTTDEGHYVRKKVRYGNASDDVVWAWLLIPKSAKDGSVPAIICLPGSFMTPNWGKDAPAGLQGPLNKGDPESYGRDFAAAGYIVLCPDYPCAGERTAPSLKSHDTTELDKRFPNWTRMGMSTWDVSRGIDFLLTLPEVDAQRIGCTGWSQGGLTSLLGAAKDPRIAVTVSVCGWSPWRGRPLTGTLASYNFPRLRPFVEQQRPLPVDLDEVAALIAPRPLLNINARADRYFPNRQILADAESELARYYRWLNAATHFQAISIPGDHAYSQAAADASRKWFDRWLRGAE